MRDALADSRKNIIDYLPLMLIFVIFAFALTDVLTIYKIGGINWDFIAEVLYAKSLLTLKFYSALFGGYLSSAISYGNAFYFEALRPPLIGVLMAPFMALGDATGIPLYLAFVLLLLLASLFYLSKEIGISPLLLALLFFTPYVIFFFLMLNGSEIVTMSFLLIFLGLLLKKRWESGILLAVASLAKYDSLIFLLMLALLPDKTRKRAFAAFIITTLPWLIFNTIAFHNPIYSYLVSAGSFSEDAQGLFSIHVIAESLKLALPDLVPAFLIVVALLLIRQTQAKRSRSKTKNDYRHRVVLASLAVGLLGWLLTAISGSLNDLPREAFLIYFGIALALGLAITDLSKLPLNLPFGKDLHAYAVGALFVPTLGMLVCAYTSLYTSYVFGTYGSTNPLWETVAGTLTSVGLSGCNVVSNNWVYLIYAGVKAHYPYYYNTSIQRYPIVFFTNMGSNSTPINFKNVTSRMNFTNFYIAFPKNYTCG